MMAKETLAYLLENTIRRAGHLAGIVQKSARIVHKGVFQHMRRELEELEKCLVQIELMEDILELPNDARYHLDIRTADAPGGSRNDDEFHISAGVHIE